MKKNQLLLALLLVFCHTLFAQQSRPVIRATSAMVDIRDNGKLSRKTWTITPKLKPDVYTTPHKNARVSFITDSDSISFKVRPGRTYDFSILLNGKDTAWTRVKYEPVDKGQQPAYLDILKKASRYNYSDHREIPRFTYQPASTPELVALKEHFRLDSVAGEGNEVSKIINLMHWVHNLVPHDGTHDNPVVKNAMNMITECKRDHKGLNCRGLATVLNECYLAEGIRSRFITCMPKDSVFDDCHVINMVWSNDAGKWLWMDPTNDAYVMNENGDLLGIREVRERLISGKAMIINPDANWNHRSSAVKEEYLYRYMTKNLYRLETPVGSEYDTETSSNGKRVDYVELLPLDGYRQEPQKTEKTGTHSRLKYTDYKTNNPDLFWAKPW